MGNMSARVYWLSALHQVSLPKIESAVRDEMSEILIAQLMFLTLLKYKS